MSHLTVVDNSAPSRPVPYNLEAEQALLGAILLNNDVMERVADFLDPGHFYDPLHQQIFEACSHLIRVGKVATPITLKTFFNSPEHAVGALTAAQYLGNLAAAATTLMNAAAYGHTIYDLSMRRGMIIACEDAVTAAYDVRADGEPHKLVEALEAQLYSLVEHRQNGASFQPFTSSLTRAIEMAAAAYQRDGGLSGLATGLRDLDAKLGGLQASDLIIIAARPGMGKTALATNIAYNIAKAYRTATQPDGTEKAVDGAIVGFFSLEMSAEQLATRILAEQAEIPSEKIRRGQISEKEFNKLAAVSQTMATIPLYIDQTGGISVAQLAGRARRLKRKQGLGLLVVDYLQLLTSATRKENRVQEMTEITTSLKALAKELEVPIIALSQLNRGVEAREDKRPKLADLRESGSIEQDADVVMFLYREEYYLQLSEPQQPFQGCKAEVSEKHAAWVTALAAASGKAEAIIGKQRHGPTGTVALQFDAQFTRFADPARPNIPDRHK